MEDNYNLDEVKGFVKSYCDPEVDVDQQLKDSAWILLQELNKCPNHNQESDEKENEEEESQEEEVAEEEKESIKHEDEKVITKEKPKKSSKENSSYLEYAKKQVKSIGAAGVIAMSAGAYSQAEVIKTESIVIVNHIRKEVPAFDEFLNKMSELMSRILAFNNVPSNTNQNTSQIAPSSAQKTDKKIVTTESTKTDEIAIEDAAKTQEDQGSIVEQVNNEIKVITEEKTTPVIDSIEQPPSGGIDIIDAQNNPIPMPIIVNPTTEVNPSKN
jgi:hypothetical protein